MSLRPPRRLLLRRHRGARRQGRGPPAAARATRRPAGPIRAASAAACRPCASISRSWRNRPVPPRRPAPQRLPHLRPGLDQAVEGRGAGLHVAQGRRRLVVDQADALVDAAALVGLEGVGGPLGGDAAIGDVGAGGALEPPGVDGEPLDEQGAGEGLGVPLGEEAVAEGVEGGGVLAGEDELVGAEPVRQGVEPDPLAVLRPPRLRAVDPAGLALLLGPHGVSPSVGARARGARRRAHQS